MYRDRAVILGLTLVAVGGCVTGAQTAVGTYYERTTVTGLGDVLRACNPTITASVCNVRLTSKPGDTEAWYFEARIKNVVNGIPVGREPVDFVVVGDQQRCETARGSLTVTGLYGKDTPPTEPCKGPQRFEAAVPPTR